MELSTGISTNFDRTFSFDAIENYNQFLKNNSSFKFDDNVKTDFETALETASKNYPVRDKNDPAGLGHFADRMGASLSDSLNAVNNIKLEADRMQEDLAMGGPTSIHDAMIAAEKASLSMQMAVQVRNRILSAYTEISNMAI